MTRADACLTVFAIAALLVTLFMIAVDPTTRRKW